MSVKAVQVRSKTPGENRLAGSSFLGKLKAGELLNGAPTATIEPNDGELTVSEVARNTVTLTIRKGEAPDPEDDVCAANQAVTWRVTGGRPGTRYKVTIRCPTSLGDTLELVCYLEVKNQ